MASTSLPLGWMHLLPFFMNGMSEKVLTLFSYIFYCRSFAYSLLHPNVSLQYQPMSFTRAKQMLTNESFSVEFAAFQLPLDPEVLVEAHIFFRTFFW